MGITTVEAELTVTHEELDPGMSETYDEDSFDARRALKCAWAERHAFARELRGWISGDWPNFTVHLPHRYPEVPGAFVRSIGMKGKAKSSADAGNTERISYANGFAQLNVGYSTTGQSEGQGGGDNPIAIVTESLESAAQLVTLSGEKFAFVAPPGEPDAEPVDPGAMLVVTRMVDWVYTIHQITTLPTAFLGLVGFVNNSQIVIHSLNFTFDPETLVYQGASPRRIITTEGAEAWEITLRFTFRRYGWNKWWQSGRDEPQPAYTVLGPYKPFPSTNFVNQLVLP